MSSCFLVRVRIVLPAVLLATFGSSVRADVWNVRGPNPDFGQIHQAVAAASDGDVIRVYSGDYDVFQVDNKSLSIVVVHPLSATVNGVSRIKSLDADKTVVIRGLRGLGSNADALVVHDNEGAIRLEGCAFTGAYGATYGVRVINSADTAFVNCAVGGWGTDATALWVGMSTVSILDSTVRGGWGHTWGGLDYVPFAHGGDGGTGLHGVESTITLSGSDILGGEGGDGQWYGFANGGDGGDGGHAVDALTCIVRAQDCLIAGGSGGEGGFGNNWGFNGQDATPGTTVQVITGAARSFSADPLGTSGDTLDMEFNGEPGDLVVLLVSGGPNHYFASVAHGNLLIARGGLTRSVLGTVDGSGQLLHNATLPTIGALETLTLHYQALFQSTTGGLYLGPAQVVTVLGAGF